MIHSCPMVVDYCLLMIIIILAELRVPASCFSWARRQTAIRSAKLSSKRALCILIPSRSRTNCFCINVPHAQAEGFAKSNARAIKNQNQRCKVPLENSGVEISAERHEIQDVIFRK